MRKAAYVVAAILVAYLFLVVVLPRVVSLEGLRPRIIAALEEKSGRKATFSKISLSMFPGVGVKVGELSLSGDPGFESERLLDAPEAEIRFAIIPLLSGRPRFTKIILVRPAILFRIHADGTTSVSEMLRRISLPPSAPLPADGNGVSFAIDSLDIREARVALRLPGGDGRERAYDIVPVTARIAGAGGGSRTDFDVAGHIGGKMRGHVALAGRLEKERGGTSAYRLNAVGDLFRQDLSVDGKIVTSGGVPEIDLALSMPKIRMGDLAELLREPSAALAKARLEGTASLSAKLSGTPEALGFEIDADLNDAGWTVLPGIQKFIDMPCNVVIQGRRFPDQLLLSNAELRFPPLLLIGNLSVVPATGAYEWSASSRITSLVDFAKSRGEFLQRWSPTGRLTASGRGSRVGGDAAGSWNIGVDLGEVGFQKPESDIDFGSLEGHLVLSPGAVEFSPLAGLFNGQRFSLRGKMARGETVPGEVAAGPLDLKMAFLDLDALFPADPPKVAFLANLSVDAGRAKGVDFRDLSGQVRFEKGIHTFEKMKAKVFGGEAEATGRIDTTGSAPDFRARIALANVEASQLLATRTTLGNFVSGPVTMTVELGGRIRDFGEFSRSATGEGVLSVSAGKIRGIDLPGKAARLAGLSAFVPPDAVRETPFSRLSAGFRIGGGKIRTDLLRIDSDRFGLEGSAAFGFDKTVDFVGRVRLPVPLSGRIRGTEGKFLAGPGGRIEIPLVVSGGLASPAMAIDSGALAKGK